MSCWRLPNEFRLQQGAFSKEKAKELSQLYEASLKLGSALHRCFKIYSRVPQLLGACNWCLLRSVSKVAIFQEFQLDPSGHSKRKSNGLVRSGCGLSPMQAQITVIAIKQSLSDSIGVCSHAACERCFTPGQILMIATTSMTACRGPGIAQ